MKLGKDVGPMHMGVRHEKGKGKQGWKGKGRRGGEQKMDKKAEILSSLLGVHGAVVGLSKTFHGRHKVKHS